MVFGLIFTFWAKERRVARDYVAYETTIMRVKEKLSASDDE